MNIKKAKEQVKNTIRAYLTQDSFGNYLIPVSRQRPLFLLGAPGIGKTAIMEQIAGELGLGLISYSMTHHTRQSALGLPFISHKTYDGVEYAVTEYTMSEIIASMYEMREKSGVREGILFLDEINCVSETLSPAMLQFLQFKVFGGHSVPEGWIVVTAGNPPEFNNSVREFDVVTMDRLKIIEVDPDYEAWKEYAYRENVHSAVIRYLDVRRQYFYGVETTVEGKQYVTARGWEDLSDMLKLYEAIKAPVDADLIAQYMRQPKIARDFAIYYQLYRKYKSDYQIEEILEGRIPAGVKDKIAGAAFDERLSLLGLLLDAVTADSQAVIEEQELLAALLPFLKQVRAAADDSEQAGSQTLTAAIEAQRQRIERLKTLGRSAKEAYLLHYKLVDSLTHYAALYAGEPDATEHGFAAVKNAYNNRSEQLTAAVVRAKARLNKMFIFLETVFGEAQEMLVAVTELTANYFTSKFISAYGCDKYFAHNKELLFHERGLAILQDLKLLETL
jgi:hypothetical protein